MELTEERQKQLKRIGRYMSLLLRHSPEKEDLSMNKRGWVVTTELCKKLDLTKVELRWIVENNDKNRFSFSEREMLIRANQGHSIDLEFDFEEVIDVPYVLYHGTATKKVGSIRKEGLKKMDRHHVHLSIDVKTAIQVGSRHGTPYIFKIDSYTMHKDGLTIYLSDNGVYLVDAVDPKYFFN